MCLALCSRACCLPWHRWVSRGTSYPSVMIDSPVSSLTCLHQHLDHLTLKSLLILSTVTRRVETPCMSCKDCSWQYRGRARILHWDHPGDRPCLRSNRGHCRLPSPSQAYSSSSHSLLPSVLYSCTRTVVLQYYVLRRSFPLIQKACSTRASSSLAGWAECL